MPCRSKNSYQTEVCNARGGGLGGVLIAWTDGQSDGGYLGGDNCGCWSYNPCVLQRTDPWRYSGRMGSKVRSNWRKSSQWAALTRSHTQAIVADSEFYPKFQSYCRAAFDHDYNRCAPSLCVLPW